MKPKSSEETVTRDVAFMFPGQGSQYVNMGYDLYEANAGFRTQIDHCSEILQPHLGLDLRDILYPNTNVDVAEASERLTQTAMTQPALFAIEWALAQCWMHLGVQPAAMVGYSIGEYVAACLAGVFELEDALALVATRGRLMQQLPAGRMLAVSLSEHEIRSWLPRTLSIAAVNAPSLCVVSGETAEIEELATRLAARRVECRRLQTSHAFHSPMMEPIMERFKAEVEHVSLKPPSIPFVSNVTGAWIAATDATAPSYWAAHLRRTVRFADSLGAVLSASNRVLLEVGPGQTFTALAKQHPSRSEQHVILSSTRHPKDAKSDVAFMLGVIGELWLAGVQIDWPALYPEPRRRVSLPTYPFERRHYWMEAPSPRLSAPQEHAQLSETSPSTTSSTFQPGSERSFQPKPPVGPTSMASG